MVVHVLNEEGIGPCLYSDDSLDVAAAQQRTDRGSKSKQRRRGGEKRDCRSFGRANLERGGSRVMPSDGSDDPLDIAVSQQRSNRGSSSKDIAPPKLKKNNKGGKREVFVGQLQKWGRGSTKSNKREKDSILRMMRKR